MDNRIATVHAVAGDGAAALPCQCALWDKEEVFDRDIVAEEMTKQQKTSVRSTVRLNLTACSCVESGDMMPTA